MTSFTTEVIGSAAAARFKAHDSAYSGDVLKDTAEIISRKCGTPIVDETLFSQRLIDQIFLAIPVSANA